MKNRFSIFWENLCVIWRHFCMFVAIRIKKKSLDQEDVFRKEDELCVFFVWPQQRPAELLRCGPVSVSTGLQTSGSSFGQRRPLQAVPWSAPCLPALQQTVSVLRERNQIIVCLIWLLLLCSFSIADFDSLIIVGTNNISEKSIAELNSKVKAVKSFSDAFVFCSRVSTFPFQENEISVVGVGTHLVTCTEQPSLGCVYKVNLLSRSVRARSVVTLTLSGWNFCGFCVPAGGGGRTAEDEDQRGPREKHHSRKKSCVPVDRCWR